MVSLLSTGALPSISPPRLEHVQHVQQYAGGVYRSMAVALGLVDAGCADAIEDAARERDVIRAWLDVSKMSRLW